MTVKRPVDPRLVPWIILMCGLFQIVLAVLISASVVFGVTPFVGAGGLIVLASLAWCWAVGTLCVVLYLLRRRELGEALKLLREP